MKPYHAIIVFCVLVSSAALASLHFYRTAVGDIVQDMNQALAITLQEKQEGWITPDKSALVLSTLRGEGMLLIVCS
ncbi:MAG: hypothetical protein I3J02_05170 [Prevotella sp.]|nr:hypothetical protein [Prevotella sp.]